MADTIDTQYHQCHPRTRWYLHEIAYCLERYFGYTREAAEHTTLSAPQFTNLARCAIEDEQLFWHHLPLAWAYKAAVQADSATQDVSPTEELEYQKNRYFRPPPEAQIREDK